MRIAYCVYDSNDLQNYSGMVDRNNKNFDQIRKICSANFGNLVFKYGARKLFSDNVSLCYVTYNDNVELLKGKFDLLVLPEANLVNPNVNYQKPANFIKELDIPVLIYGVGAQGDLTSSTEDFMNLMPGTVDFLNQVARRTETIFCRGKFTKNILAKLGIDNVMDVGCPSYMINPSPTLWSDLKSKDISRIGGTEGVYHPSKRNPMMDRFERKLFELVTLTNTDYIGQCQNTVLKTGLGLYDEVSDRDINGLNRYLAPAQSIEEFKDNIRKVCKAYVKVDDWICSQRKLDAVIGTRIHGNMTGLQAGIYCMPVVHDSRLLELCESMSFPYLTLEETASIDLVDDFKSVFISKYAKFDHSEADDRRSEIANIYRTSIIELGLTPSNGLNSIARV